MTKTTLATFFSDRIHCEINISSITRPISLTKNKNPTKHFTITCSKYILRVSTRGGQKSSRLKSGPDYLEKTVQICSVYGTSDLVHQIWFLSQDKISRPDESITFYGSEIGKDSPKLRTSSLTLHSG